MRNEWFLDVLNDLKSFAEANDLCVVAAKLDDLGDIARSEMAAVESCATDRFRSDDAGPSGRIH